MSWADMVGCAGMPKQEGIREAMVVRIRVPKQEGIREAMVVRICVPKQEGAMV